MPSLLLVEDDADLGGVLRQFLDLSGFRTVHARTGREALAHFQAAPPDLAILDVGLPDGDGFALAEAMKAFRPAQPVLFLTARALKADRLHGLSLADDYVTKPFEADELLLRIANVLRRTGRLDEAVLPIGAFRLHRDTRLLERGGQSQVLSPREAELLALLVERRNRLTTRAEILTRVWGEADYFRGRSMDVFISRLRKLLSGDPRLTLESVRGTGFILRLPD